MRPRTVMLLAASLAAAIPVSPATTAWTGPVSVPVPVTGDADGHVADLAVGPDGRAIVAIRGRRPLIVERTSHGARFAAPVEIGKRQGRVREMRVALGPSGEAICVWTFRGRRELRWSQRPAGGAWGPVGVIRASQLTGFGRVPPVVRLAIDPSGRGVILLTPGRRDEFRARVLRQIRPSGPRWETFGADLEFARVVHDGFEADFAADAVAMDARGNIAVAAVTAGSAPDVVVTRRAAGGRAWTTPRRLGRVGAPSRTHVAVAADGAGVAVAWSDARKDVAAPLPVYDPPPSLSLAVRRPTGWKGASVPGLGRRPGDVRVAMAGQDVVLAWSFDTRNLVAPPVPAAIGAALWRGGTPVPQGQVLHRSEGFFFGQDALAAFVAGDRVVVSWVLEEREGDYDAGVAVAPSGGAFAPAPMPPTHRGITLDATDRLGYSVRLGFSVDGYGVAADGAPRGTLRVSSYAPD